MTVSDGSRLRTLAFGDVDGGFWGAAVSGANPAVAFGDATGATATSGALEATWSPDGRGWRLVGDGFDLHVEPAGEDLEQTAAADETEAVSGFQELCRVQGTVTLSAAARSVDCVGTRCVIEGVDAGSLGSARSVSGWFADDDAFMLLALRAADTLGQLRRDREQRANVGGEQEPVTFLAPEQRLLAERITGRGQSPGVLVPHRKREHPVDAVQGAFAPLAPSVE